MTGTGSGAGAGGGGAGGGGPVPYVMLIGLGSFLGFAGCFLTLMAPAAPLLEEVAADFLHHLQTARSLHHHCQAAA